jgi:hypothetical protein
MMRRLGQGHGKQVATGNHKQLAILFNLLGSARLLKDMERERALQQFLEVPDISDNRWSSTSIWQMVESVDHVLVGAILLDSMPSQLNQKLLINPIL